MLYTPVLKHHISLLYLLLQIFCYAWAAPPVIQYELNNGLKVVLQEDHRSSVAEVQMWYKVGGLDEPKGMTGASHALEHMMFNGTKQTAPGEFDRILSNIGAIKNAFTSNDVTVYHESVTSNHLPVILALEADRMQNLTLSEEIFKTEHQAIMEEWRSRYVDSPDGYISGHFNTVAFPLSPYRQPVLGWPDDIKNLNTKKLKMWYKKWYHPNNATLVIVGDIKPDKIKSQIDKYFSSIPSAPLPERASLKDLDAPGQRSITVQHPQASIPDFIMGFNVPVIQSNNPDNWEPYALRMLVGILDGGNSARFNTVIVRQKELATTLSTYYAPFQRGDNLLEFIGSPNSAKNISSNQVIKGIWSLINELKHNAPKASELARARAQIKANQVYNQDDIAQQALMLGTLVTLGFPADWQDSYYQKFDAVTPEQIQQVARKYLIPSRLSTGYLIPAVIPKIAGNNNE
ncbi:hypothetical protein ACH42_03340 [Endozoicomonas sp. (ex Bugula neritina AB1)]|nr:hypothetical protein ACH42_03340 [Endozoicomonas sp. (ex Bugula neritina AB1)]